jgi:methylated-DNA-protein-cysteine methyltransferase-like protein
VSLDYDTAEAFISTIPEGCWTTYGDVADAAGNRKAAQSIGLWLRDSGGSIPYYWRVINAEGDVPEGFVASIAGLPGNAAEARHRLASEGVMFDGERASDRSRYTVEEWRAAGRPSGAEAAAASHLHEVESYVAHHIVDLPARLDDLRAMIDDSAHPANSVVLNRAIIALAPDDLPARNRLGRAYQELGLPEQARSAFEAVIELDPTNSIAKSRLQQLSREDRRGGRSG